MTDQSDQRSPSTRRAASTGDDSPLREMVRERFQQRLASAGPVASTDPRRVELYRLAEAARTLVERLVATEAPVEALAATADDLESAAGRLKGFRRGSVYEFAETANAAGEPMAQFDHSPLIGKANPLAPPLTISVERDRVIGTVTFGSAYEGPPGCVHGGFVAAVFDELLGATQGFGGQPGMTGTLTIRYRSPTPLQTPLRMEGWLEGVEGRKTFVKGTCSTEDGTLTAEADGIFISIDPSRFGELRKAREERNEALRRASSDDLSTGG